MADKTVRSLFRGSLLSALQEPTLIKSVTVHQSGQFHIDTADWAEYWPPVTDLHIHEVDKRLESLRGIWLEYIACGFDSSHVADYCYNYFRLLNSVDAVVSTSVEMKYRAALRTVLAFECFAILTSPADSHGKAGATTTLRNPAYLMAKLNAPNSPDSTGYLPLIMLAASEDAELFYHYRQLTLVPNSQLSLLIFPAASNRARTASFLTVDAFSNFATSGVDPRSEQRAKRIVNKVIDPVIRQWSAEKDTYRGVEIVDIGAGSGSLVSTTLKRSRTRLSAESGSCRVRVWSVDLVVRDPLRFLRGESIKEKFDCVTFFAEDNRRWLDSFDRLPASNGIRIGIISKLLNNLSKFDITGLSWADLCMEPKARRSFEKSDVHNEKFLGQVCYGFGDGDRAVSFQNRQIAADSSCSCILLSLSAFYRSMHRLTGCDSNDGREHDFYAPARIFNEESLLSANGASILDGLLDVCDLLFIEDYDLFPQTLKAHILEHCDGGITAVDVSRTLRLRDNHAYLLWKPGENSLDLNIRNASRLVPAS